MRVGTGGCPRLSPRALLTNDGLDGLRQWMGTFYHRLPLLDPGPFGVGTLPEGWRSGWIIRSTLAREPGLWSVW